METRAISAVQLTPEAFEELVVEVLDAMPPELLTLLDNVDVVIEQWPSKRQLTRAGLVHGTLYGLYEGVPLTRRDSGYQLVAPDKITIFQRPIERSCASPKQVAEQVRTTVIHEIAHHFGIGEARLEELGWS
jgi:predicted Zn-dependent protease with MMP-like domain